MEISGVQSRGIDAMRAPLFRPRASSFPEGGGRAIEREFEAFVLKTAFEQLMSERPSGWFGSGFQGAVWKSIFVEAVAREMAEEGRLRIVSSVKSVARE